jgi:hypothetical protein
MVLLTSNQDLSQASGIIDFGFFESMYECMMDEAMLGLGRIVTFHLEPEIRQDVTTQSQPAPQQYNPFFNRTPVPSTNTRNTGARVEPRDVEYSAHIRLGPLSADEDNTGMGELTDTQAIITVVIEALEHVEKALSVSVEGRRYSIDRNRPIGFSKRKYLMLKLEQIQEREPKTPDNTIG